MKVMIDTNVIISAVLFPQGKAAYAFEKAIMPPYQPLICDYIGLAERTDFPCHYYPNRRKSAS